LTIYGKTCVKEIRKKVDDFRDEVKVLPLKTMELLRQASTTPR